MAKVRCRCGHMLKVPDKKPRDLPILHCSACGGPLKADAQSCDYCGGVVDRDKAKYTVLCPRCFARLKKDFRYCVSCAHPIRPQTLILGEETSRSCPRCEVGLHTRKMDDVTVEECPTCSGLWLSSNAFREISKKKVEEFHQNPLPERRAGTKKLDPVVYIKCPDCGVLMNRKNFGRRSGVIVDECLKHGLWLDDEELERIARFIAEGGLQEARKLEAEEIALQAERSRRKAAAPPTRLGSSAFPFRPTVSRGGGLVSFLFDFLMD